MGAECSCAHRPYAEDMRFAVVARVVAVWLVLAAPAFADCVMVGPGCSLYDYRGIVFVGTVVEADDPVYRMRVDEPFRGVKGQRTLDVLNVVYEGYSGFEGAGKQYLVFADPFQMDGRNYAKLGDCVRNMIEISRAHALVEQLRRKQQRQPVAALFGQVMRTAYNTHLWNPDYRRGLSGIQVIARSAAETLRTTTAPDGSYMFDRLRRGAWVVTAELPPSLAHLESLAVTMDVERGDCREADVEVYPRTRISGRVVGPDGVVRTDPWVRLYRADAYPYNEKDARTYGIDRVLGQTDRFTFQGIPPGDYILAFGNATRINPEHPFALTHYPNAARVEDATVIHLQEGQQIDDADIQLPTARATRTITVAVDWNGRDPLDYSPPEVLVKTANYGPFARRVSAETFRMNLLIDAQYEISAFASCRFARRQVVTDSVVVSGPDGADRVTLKFPPGDCR